MILRGFGLIVVSYCELVSALQMLCGGLVTLSLLVPVEQASTPKTHLEVFMLPCIDANIHWK